MNSSLIRLTTILMLGIAALMLPVQMIHHAMAFEHDSAFRMMEGQDNTSCAKTACLAMPSSDFFIAAFPKILKIMKMLSLFFPIIGVGIWALFRQPIMAAARISSLSMQMLMTKQRK